jgi:hypothetical protein
LATADASMHERACRVRDELHAVANRVGRLLETPGARLAPIEIPPPHIGPGARRAATGTLIGFAAERLADMVEDLTASEWCIEGRIGDSTTTIEELVARALHTARQDLERSRARIDAVG